MRVARFVPLERFSEFGVQEDRSHPCELVSPTFEAGSVFVDSAVTHRAVALSRTPRSELTLSSGVRSYIPSFRSHLPWLGARPEAVPALVVPPNLACALPRMASPPRPRSSRCLWR